MCHMRPSQWCPLDVSCGPAVQGPLRPSGHHVACDQNIVLMLVRDRQAPHCPEKDPHAIRLNQLVSRKTPRGPAGPVETPSRGRGPEAQQDLLGIVCPLPRRMCTTHMYPGHIYAAHTQPIQLTHATPRPTWAHGLPLKLLPLLWGPVLRMEGLPRVISWDDLPMERALCQRTMRF